jgi:hypothetical protein
VCVPGAANVETVMGLLVGSDLIIRAF